MEHSEHVIFTMDAFDEVVTEINKLYMRSSGDLPRSAMRYKFFSYDIAVNHLRLLLNPSCPILDNSKGIRGSLIPTVMEFILNHPDITIVTIEQLIYTELEGHIGITTNDLDAIMMALDGLNKDMTGVHYMDAGNVSVAQLESLTNECCIKGITKLHVNCTIDELEDSTITIGNIMNRLEVQGCAEGRLKLLIKSPEKLEYLRLGGSQNTLRVTNIDKLKNLKYLEFDGSYNYQDAIARRSIPTNTLTNLVHLGVPVLSTLDIQKHPNLLSLVVSYIMPVSELILPRNLLYLDLVESRRYQFQDVALNLEYLRVLQLTPFTTLDVSRTLLPQTSTIISIVNHYNSVPIYPLDLRIFENLQVFMCRYFLSANDLITDNIQVGITNIPLNINLIRYLTLSNIYYSLDPDQLKYVNDYHVVQLNDIYSDHRVIPGSPGYNSLNCLDEFISTINIQ